MSTSPTPLLSALCGPQPASGLLGESWPPAPSVNHGDPARLPAALKAPELSSLARLFAVYRGMVSFGNARSDSRTFAVPQADPGLLFRMGLSLYLTDIADCIPALAPMLRSLEAELGAPAGCARIGAFAAARGNGVTCHLDAEEVFSIQLAGRKRFRYAPAPDLANPWGRQFNPGDPCDDDLYPQVAEGFPDPRKAHFQSAEMRPGSVLFMPRGTWHETEADALPPTLAAAGDAAALARRIWAGQAVAVTDHGTAGLLPGPARLALWDLARGACQVVAWQTHPPLSPEPPGGPSFPE